LESTHRKKRIEEGERRRKRIRTENGRWRENEE